MTQTTAADERASDLEAVATIEVGCLKAVRRQRGLSTAAVPSFDLDRGEQIGSETLATVALADPEPLDPARRPPRPPVHAGDELARLVVDSRAELVPVMDARGREVGVDIHHPVGRRPPDRGGRPAGLDRGSQPFSSGARTRVRRGPGVRSRPAPPRRELAINQERLRRPVRLVRSQHSDVDIGASLLRDVLVPVDGDRLWSRSRRTGGRAVRAEEQLVVVPPRAATSTVALPTLTWTMTGWSPSRLTSSGRAGRCSSRPSAAMSSFQNKNGAFVQTRMSRTQRPYPRRHLGRKPRMSPLATRMAPAKAPGCRITQRLRMIRSAATATRAMRSTPSTASSAMSMFGSDHGT